MKTKMPVKNPALKTWGELNMVVMKCADEKKLAALLKEEQEGRNRKSFVRRIGFRLSHIRHQNETPAWRK